LTIKGCIEWGKKDLPKQYKKALVLVGCQPEQYKCNVMLTENKRAKLRSAWGVLPKQHKKALVLVGCQPEQYKCNVMLTGISLLLGDFLPKHKKVLVLLVGWQPEQYKCDVILTEPLGNESLPLSDTRRFVRWKTLFLQNLAQLCQPTHPY
jgi:hypothetical protein